MKARINYKDGRQEQATGTRSRLIAKSSNKDVETILFESGAIAQNGLFFTGTEYSHKTTEA